MANLVQKFVLHGVSEASPLVPMHVALASGEGGPVLGSVARLGTDATTVASVRDAYNALVDALAGAGLAKIAE